MSHFEKPVKIFFNFSILFRNKNTVAAAKDKALDETISKFSIISASKEATLRILINPFLCLVAVGESSLLRQ